MSGKRNGKRNGERNRDDLSPARKHALVILLEDGSLIRANHYWASKSGRKICFQTVEALYERYLIKIVYESRHRRRHIAKLTDVGEYAASEIKRELASTPTRTPHGISEDAALFIVEVVG